MNSSASFDLQRIRDETFVRELDFHWEVDSTNSHALQQADHADVEDAAAGPGRTTNARSRPWDEPLVVSARRADVLAARPARGHLAADRLPQIALTAGLAICQAVEQFAPQADLALKWPNDVYLNERKLAGILIELPPRRPPHAVLGIGINVNNSLQAADAELAQTSISLLDAMQAELDRTDLLIACLQQIERRLNELRRRSPRT